MKAEPAVQRREIRIQRSLPDSQVPSCPKEGTPVTSSEVPPVGWTGARLAWGQGEKENWGSPTYGGGHNKGDYVDASFDVEGFYAWDRQNHAQAIPGASSSSSGGRPPPEPPRPPRPPGAPKQAVEGCKAKSPSIPSPVTPSPPGLGNPYVSGAGDKASTYVS